jgi:hypothetical protein
MKTYAKMSRGFSSCDCKKAASKLRDLNIGVNRGGDLAEEESVSS